MVKKAGTSIFRKYSILNRFVLKQFGFETFERLRNDLPRELNSHSAGDASDIYDLYLGAFIRRRTDPGLPLYEYHERILHHVGRLKRARGAYDFRLQYFQYAALMFTEWYLDMYFNRRRRLLRMLNDFIARIDPDRQYNPYSPDDLNKIAFWMATGSGKTLIMHLNYMQIEYYCKDGWNNVILITPNAGLSLQHHRELQKSKIPSTVYGGNPDSLSRYGNSILIVDIHKLTRGKSGRGISLDVRALKGPNLVFIDESHKGQRSEEKVWKSLRNILGDGGFTLEYSATFGQIMESDPGLLEEYAKSIIFDYSYRYFYGDLYGKDFQITNFSGEIDPEFYTNISLTAQLLVFYEQLRIFNENERVVREYMIERPLLIFIGGRVSGKGLNSDVIRIVRYLDAILKDRSFFAENIGGLLRLIRASGDNEIFRSTPLREVLTRESDPEFLAEKIYDTVFRGSGGLELSELTKGDGEIGLGTTGGGNGGYFGVINVGDVRALKKLLKSVGLSVHRDYTAGSLFTELNGAESGINIVIGSRKFIEGWDSWRVSSMCLLNFGKGEGPQIIQLFGRGVRLKGKNFSLKREPNPDYDVGVLQTLFIFGLKAAYIERFLRLIRGERLLPNHVRIGDKIGNKNGDKSGNRIAQIVPEGSTAASVELGTPDSASLSQGHQANGIAGRMPEKAVKNGEDTGRTARGGSAPVSGPADFSDGHNLPMIITYDPRIARSLHLEIGGNISLVKGIDSERTLGLKAHEVKIPEYYTEIIDLDEINAELIGYLRRKGYYNAILDRSLAIELIRGKKYTLTVPHSEVFEIEQRQGTAYLRLKSFDGRRELHRLVYRLLKRYIEILMDDKLHEK